jgi:hypothetical protein
MGLPLISTVLLNLYLVHLRERRFPRQLNIRLLPMWTPSGTSGSVREGTILGALCFLR